MRINNSKRASLTAASLVGLTIISGLVLTSKAVSADDVVDNVSITVPVSCTMSGTGMNTHTAEVVNGTYRADIGTTTIKAFCNDPNGFSIYAIGFSNDEYTGTNHTKLIGTNDNTKTIATGTATSGSTSNWAMKLATNSSATYPITLTNGYGSYSNVPDTYTKVAQRTSGTDVGTNATGSTLTTTYAAYMASTQAADTYVGKVKYTMVHPYDATAPVVPTPGVYTLSRADYGESYTQIGEAIPQDVEVYDTAEEAFEAGDYPGACLKHIIVNGVIAESYVVGDTSGISESPVIFEIRGGVDESGLSEKPVFTANKNTLKEVYDYSHNPDMCDDYGDYFSCRYGLVSTSENGEAIIDSGGFHCNISTSGQSSCEWQ